VLEVVVPGKVGRERPKLGWQEEVKKNIFKVGLRIGDAKDRGGGDRCCLGCHLELKTLTFKIWGKMASTRLCVCVLLTYSELLNHWSTLVTTTALVKIIG
jgi:hypothetical protein